MKEMGRKEGREGEREWEKRGKGKRVEGEGRTRDHGTICHRVEGAFLMNKVFSSNPGVLHGS